MRQAKLFGIFFALLLVPMIALACGNDDECPQPACEVGSLCAENICYDSECVLIQPGCLDPRTILCAEPPERCWYEPGYDEAGCFLPCGQIKCDAECPALICPEPREGCAYELGKDDAGCPTCGNLKCDDCPDYAAVDCRPAPDGCEYIPAYDDKGCASPCGELVCDEPSCGVEGRACDTNADCCANLFCQDVDERDDIIDAELDRVCLGCPKRRGACPPAPDNCTYVPDTDENGCPLTCGRLECEDACVVGGCSGQLCYEQGTQSGITTCEFKDEYACYQRHGECERQINGACGWTVTDDLSTCLIEAGAECPQETCREIESHCEGDDRIVKKICTYYTVEDERCIGKEASPSIAILKDECVRAVERPTAEPPEPEAAKPTSEVKKCSGCIDRGKCLDVGTIYDGTFCAKNQTMVQQYNITSECSRDYECDTGLCIDGICEKRNLWKNLINFLAKILGSNK